MRKSSLLKTRIQSTRTRFIALVVFIAMLSVAGYSTSSASIGKILHESFLNPASPTSPFFSLAQALRKKPGFEDGWSVVGHMLVPRSGAAVAKLPDGKVLIAGGETNGGYTQLVEIFDPVTKQSEIIEAQMIVPRAYASATLLQSGKVLLVGGENADGPIGSAEIFDPNTGKFSLVSGKLLTARSRHTATILPSGAVLITGGTGADGVLDTTEYYNVDQQTFIERGRLTSRRSGHSAVLSPDGELIIAGGNDGEQDLDTTEIGDTDNFTFSASEMKMPVTRVGAAAQFLEGNGTVMFAGGTVNGEVSSEAELFNPLSKTFAATKQMRMNRSTPGSALVTDTQAMVFGGRDADGNPLDTIEAYFFSTVRTDKKHYKPEEEVKITGAGWEPGETVELAITIKKESGTRERTITAIADENGNISNDEFVMGKKKKRKEYTVIATGQSSGRIAQAVFKESGLGDVYFSRQTGDWDNAATWSRNNAAGNGTQEVPTADSTVVIHGGHTVTLNTNTANLGGLEIATGFGGTSGAGTLSFDDAAARQLNVNGNGTGDVNVGALGTINITNAAGNFANPINIKGSLTNNGTIDLVLDADSVANVTFSGSGNKTVSGTPALFEFNIVEINKGAATDKVSFTAASFTMKVGGLTLTKGIFELNSATTITPFSGNVTINNDEGFAILQGTSNWGNTGKLTVDGSLTVSGGTFNAGNDAGGDEGRLEIGGTGTVSVSGSGTLNVAGGLSATTAGGTFNATGGTIRVGDDSGFTTGSPLLVTNGNFTLNSALIISRPGNAKIDIDAGKTFTGSTVTFGTNGGTFLLDCASTLNNVTIDTPGTVRLDTSNLTLAGNFTITQGTYDPSTNSLNTTVGGDWTNGGTATFTAGTVTFNASSGTQTISGAQNTQFNSLTIGTGTSTNTVLLDRDITLSNTNGNSLTVKSGATFNLATFTADRNAGNAGTLTLETNTTLKLGRVGGGGATTGTNRFPANFTTYSLDSTSTVIFEGANQTVNPNAATLTFGNLTLAGSGTKTANNNVVVAGLFLNNSGITYSGGGNSLTLNGDGGTNPSTTNLNAGIIQGVATLTIGDDSADDFTNSGAITVTNLTVNGNVLNNDAGTGVTTNNLTGAGTLTQGPNSTLLINGSTAGFVGVLNASATGNTVNYAGASQTVINPSAAGYFHLSLTGSGTDVMPAGSGGTLLILGNFTLTTGTALVTAAASNLTIGTTTTTGTGNWSIGGNVTFDSGASRTHTVIGEGNITITGILNGNTSTIDLNGNWSGSGTFARGTSTVNFSRSTGEGYANGDQTISGNAATDFNNLTLSGNGTKTASQAITVNGNFTNNAGVTFTGTTLNLQGATHTNSGAIGNAPLGTLNVAAGTLTNSAGASINANTVTVGTGATLSNSGTVTSNTVTVGTGATLSNSGTVTSNNALSGAGTFTQQNSSTLNLGGSITVTTFNASTAVNLVNYTGVSQTIVVPSGSTYHNLTVSGSGTDTIAGALTINGAFNTSTGSSLSITAGGTMSIGAGMSNGANVTYNTNNAGHTITAGGLANSGTFNAGSSTIGITAGGLTNNTGATFNGNTSTVNITAGGLTNSGTFNAGSSTIGITAGGLTNNTGATFNGDTSTVNITAGGLTNSGTFNGNTATFNVGGNLNNNAGTFTLTTGLFSLGGSFSNAGGATFNAGSGSLRVAGGWTNNGTFNANTSTITLNGSAAQLMTGPTTFNNLMINNTSGVSLAASSDQTINGTLTLTSGVVTAQNSTVFIGANGSISDGSATSYINGFLNKTFPTGAAQSFTYPIGDATKFTPVNLANLNVTVSGNVTGSTTSGDHAQIATSGIDANRSVNRKWTFTVSGGLAITSYNATFNFVAGDIDNGADTGKFVIRRFSGGTWFTTTTGIRTATSTEATGVTSFSEFAIGQQAIAKYTVSANTPQTVGVPFTTTVTALDALDVPTPSGADATVSVTMTSSSSTVRFDSNGNNTFGEGGDNIFLLTTNPKTISTRETTANTITLTATSTTPSATGTSGNIVVNKANTTISVSSSANPSVSVSGQSVTFTATIRHVSFGTAGLGGTITGTVTFKDGGNTIGTSIATGNAGEFTATFATATLSTATHSITVEYSGDSNFNGSNSNASPLSQVVNKANTTVAVTSNINPSVTGQQITLTATVSITAPGSNAVSNPTGTVTFFDGATNIGTGALNGLNPSQATLNISTLSVGTHANITAVYAGDTNFNSSTSPSFSQTVNKASTTTAVTSSVNPSVFGQQVTFTATVSITNPGTNAIGNPTGTVTFFDGATNIGTGTLNGQNPSQATLNISTLSVGTHANITAVYAGDTNFNSSTSLSFSQTVNKASTTTAVTSSVNPSVFGQQVTFTATVTAVVPGAGTPTGTVTFKDGTSTLATLGLSSGQVSFTTSQLSVATHSITVEYGGDGNFNSSTSSALTQVVNKASTTTSVASSLNPSNFGQSITFTATIIVQSPGSTTVANPTGTVTFFSGENQIGSPATVSTSGGVTTASISTDSLNAGVRSITATYNGDGNFNTSTSSAFSQTINKVTPTTTTLTSNTNPSVFGQSVTFTATVTSGLTVKPTGTVTFKDNNVALGGGTVTLGGTQTAQFSTSSLTVASHPITADYSGDNNYNSVTISLTGGPNPPNQVVNKANTTTVVTSSANPSITGQLVNFTVTVTAVAPGAGTPSGTVALFDGAASIGSGTLVGGSATIPVASLSVGNHTITANYLGDASFNGSSAGLSPAGGQNGNPQVVNKGNTSVAITSTPNPSNVGQQVTFTVTVTVTSGFGTPTGSVTFNDGGTVLGSANLSTTGGVTTAVFTTTSLVAGARNITAAYAGDANFNGGSASLVQTVNKIVTTTTAANATANFNDNNQNVTLTATVTAAGGAAVNEGTVTFTVSSGGTTIGAPVTSGTVANGVATATFVLPGGTLPATLNIAAAYSGSATFATSSDNTKTLTVAAAPTTTTTANATAVYNDAAQNLTLTATVVGSVVNQGTVTFTISSGATTIGTPVTSAALTNGTATVTYVLPGGTLPGNYTITASFSGGTKFAASSDTKTLTVSRAASTTTGVNATAVYNDNNQTVALSATVASANGAVNEGTVTFTVSSGGTTVGTAVTSGTVANGAATASYVLPGGTLPGALTVTAAYSGGTRFSASSDATKTLTVNKAPTTVAVQDKQLVFNNAAQTVTLTATVTGSVVNEGTVTFQVKDGALNVGAAVTSAVLTNGNASVVYTIPGGTAARTYTISASYSGGVKFLAGSGTGNLTINADATAPVITITSPTNGQFLKSTTVNVTGTVEDVGNGVASVTVNNVAATITGNSYSATITLSEGAQGITARATDNAGNVSTANVTVTVDVTNPVISITSPAAGSFVGKSITVTGTVNDANLSTVTVNGQAAAVSGNTFSVTLTNASSGALTITATATDRAGNSASDSKAVTGDVTGPTITYINPAATDGILKAGLATNEVKIRVEDSGSGVSASSVRINGVLATRNPDGTFSVFLSGLLVGPVSITATASDNVGNSTTSSTTNTKAVAPGDANGDNKIDINDLLLMIQMLVGTAPTNVGADVNGDGRIDVADLIRIIIVIRGTV